MNSSSDEKFTEHPRCGNCRTSRRLRLGIFSAFLLVVGATFGALMSAAIAHGVWATGGTTGQTYTA